MSARRPDPDEVFMRRTLTLARRGLGRVSPNPMVGCVLVKDGRIVAEGWHRRFGGPHAECDALSRAGARARGATVFVNLEPCCHHGKTPPCTDALIAAGVRRVVTAMRDPDPRVAGKGLAALRRAGIRVSLGPMAEEARGLNRAFVTWQTRGRPYVVLKAAASLDGRIETSRRQSKWISSPETRREFRVMRSRWDGILAGIGTVLADDPRLTAARGGRNPVRIILDSRLRIPRRAKLLRRPGRVLLVTAARADRGLSAPPKVRVLRVPRGKGGLSLPAALRALAAAGISSLLVEGGSAVHTSFLEAGLVDEVLLILSPRLVGGAAARSFYEGRGAPFLKAAPLLARIAVRRLGPDIVISGMVETR